MPWEQSGVSNVACPGFCGKLRLPASINASTSTSTSLTDGGIFHNCGACPWGSKAINSLYCEPCTEGLQPYDVAFIVFHALLPLLINTVFIKSSAIAGKNLKIPRVWIVAQIFCALLEGIASMLLSILLFEPIGSLSINSCQNHQLHQWYPMWYNPVINYTRTLRCTSEVVYPLFSLPFANLAMNLGVVIVFRSALYILSSNITYPKLPSQPYYSVLWTLPIIAVFHAALSGIIYYAFPYLLLLTSLSLNVFHFASAGRKGIFSFLATLVKDPEHFVIYVLHLALFSFSLYSILLSLPSFTGAIPSLESLLLIVGLLPLPSVFYVLTIRLTVPFGRTSRFRL